MNKIKNYNNCLIVLSSLVMLGLWLVKVNYVKADFWERPRARPTQPSFERDRLPTPTGVTPTLIQPSPTSLPVGGLPSPTPTSVPSDGGRSVSEDPCASGKSYTGPYCGWSPSVGGQAQPVSGEPSRIGGPQVLGLSKTSSGDLEPSDIILLTGVLCLLLYLRSKLSQVVL